MAADFSLKAKDLFAAVSVRARTLGTDYNRAHVCRFLGRQELAYWLQELLSRMQESRDLGMQIFHIVIVTVTRSWLQNVSLRVGAMEHAQPLELHLLPDSAQKLLELEATLLLLEGFIQWARHNFFWFGDKFI